MDRAYKINTSQRRDEWPSRYSTDGKPDMVDYALALEGEDGWIKLSQKVTTKPPTDGDELFGHIETKTNANGKEYRKFVKAQRQNGGSYGGGGGIDPNKVDYIILMLEELTGRKDVVAPVEDDSLDDPFKELGI